MTSKVSRRIAELPPPPTGEDVADLTLLASELLVLHRVTSRRGVELATSIAAAVLAPGTGSASRTELGLHGQVFFWVGHCAYPTTSLILIWDGAFEDDADRREHARAAPWDTGGLCSKRTLGCKLTPVEAIETIERYSLPPPAYRAYLAEVLARCYLEPSGYLAGARPRPRYPGHVGPVTDADPPRHTFELRVPGDVAIEPNLIALAWDKTAFSAHPEASEAIQRFAGRQGLALFDRRGQESMSRVAERAVRELLRQRGLSP